MNKPSHQKHVRIARERATKQKGASRLGNEKSKTFVKSCSECGADIRIVKMPNGGTVVYEVKTNVPHPCYNRGRDITVSFDPYTMDMFSAD